MEQDETWSNYRDMAGRYWMSHQFRLGCYFWCCEGNHPLTHCEKRRYCFDVRWQQQGREGSWQNNSDGCVETRMRNIADQKHKVWVCCSSDYHDMSAVRWRHDIRHRKKEPDSTWCCRHVGCVGPSCQQDTKTCLQNQLWTTSEKTTFPAKWRNSNTLSFELCQSRLWLGTWEIHTR